MIDINTQKAYSKYKKSVNELYKSKKGAIAGNIKTFEGDPIERPLVHAISCMITHLLNVEIKVNESIMHAKNAEEADSAFHALGMINAQLSLLCELYESIIQPRKESLKPNEQKLCSDIEENTDNDFSEFHKVYCAYLIKLRLENIL